MFCLHSRATMLLELSSELVYTPGDHVGVFACNRREIVDGILARLTDTTDVDTPVELQFQKETHTSNGKEQTILQESILELTLFSDFTIVPFN